MSRASPYGLAVTHKYITAAPLKKIILELNEATYAAIEDQLITGTTRFGLEIV